MEQVIYLSLVNASIAFTVCETFIFDGFRKTVKARSKFFGKLVSCGYCFGYWVAPLLTLLYQPDLFHSEVLSILMILLEVASGFFPLAAILVAAIFVLDYFLTSLVVAWLSAVQWILMLQMMKSTGK